MSRQITYVSKKGQLKTVSVHTRYAVVHPEMIGDHPTGYWFLTFGNHNPDQHYDTPGKAKAAMISFAQQLYQKLGIKDLRVIPVDCYPGGQAISSVYDNDYVVGKSPG